ncbi:MAG: MnhB domain-containing protein [Candidatus Margulisiibacteriota bacterium]
MNGMSLIVKTVTRVTVGVIFVFGAYIAAHGHLTLGGGIAGGVIVALAYILYVLAYGRTEAEERLSRQRALAIMTLGALLFLALALAGYRQGYFMGNFLPTGEPGKLLSAGVIPFFNLAIMLFLGAGLFVVFLTFIAFRVEVKPEPGEEIEVGNK